MNGRDGKQDSVVVDVCKLVSSWRSLIFIWNITRNYGTDSQMTTFLHLTSKTTKSRYLDLRILESSFAAAVRDIKQADMRQLTMLTFVPRDVRDDDTVRPEEDVGRLAVVGEVLDVDRLLVQHEDVPGHLVSRVRELT